METRAVKEWKFITETKDDNAIETYTGCLTYLSSLTKNSAIKCCGPYLTNKETEALRGYTFSNGKGEKKMKSRWQKACGSTDPRAAANLK